MEMHLRQVTHVVMTHVVVVVVVLHPVLKVREQESGGVAKESSKKRKHSVIYLSGPTSLYFFAARKKLLSRGANIVFQSYCFIISDTSLELCCCMICNCTVLSYLGT
jgi:hypothetical protein